MILEGQMPVLFGILVAIYGFAWLRYHTGLFSRVRDALVYVKSLVL